MITGGMERIGTPVEERTVLAGEAPRDRSPSRVRRIGDHLRGDVQAMRRIGEARQRCRAAKAAGGPIRRRFRTGSQRQYGS